MKNFYKQTSFSIFSRFLLAVVLVVGVASSGWGQEVIIYSTGFEASEGFTAGTSYNNTTIKYDGPEDEKWGTYYGTASTTGPITGSMSMQMRWYTANPDRLGYTFTDFDLTNVTKVTFKALNTSGNNVTVSYSTDGGTTYTGGQTFTLGTSAADFTYNISPTGEFPNVRIKFTLVPGTTNGSRVTIDDVTVYGIVDEPTLFASTPTITSLDYLEFLGPSASQSFQVSGTALIGTDVTVTAPTSFQVSLQENADFDTSITLTEFDGTETDIWVRLAEGLIPDDYSGDVEITGGGASQVDVSVSGTVYSVPSLTDLDVAYEQDFSGFTATSGQPVLRSHLPDGWKLDKENFTYRGDFESTTTTGGVYGNGALGIVQTGTAPNTELTSTFYLRNNTGETIEYLKIEYNGLVRRTDVAGNPEWDVYFNDLKIDELNYKTENLTDKVLSHIITGLNILDGELITIRWKTEREGTAAQKKIGITNVEITPLSELPALDNPVLSLAAGTYYSNQTVFVSNIDAYDSSVTIFYTTDGNDPDDQSNDYVHNDGIELPDGNGPITLKAIAIDNDAESG